MVLLTPHLQYVLVLTPLLLGVGVSAGSILLAVVSGASTSSSAYGLIAICCTAYAALYWVRDNGTEDQDGVVLHVGGISMLCSIVLVVISEAALFSSIVWAV